MIYITEEQAQQIEEALDNIPRLSAAKQYIRERQALATIRAARAQEQAEQEPVAWRDYVEERLLSWKQSFINRSGDQLALDDFMDKQSLDDLIEFVCSEYASPVQPVQEPERKCNYNGGTCERRGCISGCQADQLCSINNGLQFELEKTEPVKQEPYAYEFDLVLEGVDKVGYPILTKDAASIARMRENPNFSITPLYAAPVQHVKQEPVAWFHKIGCRANAFGECDMGCQPPVDVKAIRAEALEDAVKFLEENGMIAPNGFTAAGIRGLK